MKRWPVRVARAIRKRLDLYRRKLSEIIATKKIYQLITMAFRYHHVLRSTSKDLRFFFFPFPSFLSFLVCYFIALLDNNDHQEKKNKYQRKMLNFDLRQCWCNDRQTVAIVPGCRGIVGLVRFAFEVRLPSARWHDLLLWTLHAVSPISGRESRQVSRERNI